MKRIGVFIDVQNVYLTTQAVFGRGKINFSRLRDYFNNGEGNLVTLNAFTCYDPDNEGQRAFINALGLSGYRVISKPLRRLPDGSIKANMDLEMAIEVLSQADCLDEIVLVTGDGDFKVLIDYLSVKGKVVTVLGPERLTSLELIQACHRFLNLHKIEGIFDIEPREPNRFSGNGDQG